MQITGKDEMSLKVLKAINNGLKIKEIPKTFPVSIDQAKRLSRYNNMLKKVRNNLDSKAVLKFELLGLKALSLSKLFKDEDWEGLNEILTIVDEDTRRSDLSKLIKGLNEKRKRIGEAQKKFRQKLYRLEVEQKELEEMESQLQETEQKINKQVAFLTKFNYETRQFLLKHLGIYEDKLVLARRLDSNWQNNLKNKGVLNYDPERYIWFVIDLDNFVKEYEKRVNRKKPYPTEWDYEKEIKRSNGRYDVPSSPHYKLPDKLAGDLQKEIENINQRLDELKNKRISIEKEIKRLKKSSPKSFYEKVVVSDTLSEQEIKRHGELQDKAMKWLFNEGYIAISEFTLPNGKRVDCIAYNQNGHIIIIEVKASLADFQQDRKWETYLDYCNEFYFLLDFHVNYTAINKAGFLVEDKKSLEVIKESPKYTVLNNEDKMNLIYSINKNLSRKYIFGY